MMNKLVKISYDNMMDAFVPPQPGELGEEFFAGLFDDVPLNGLDADMYTPLVNSVNQNRVLDMRFKLVRTEFLSDSFESSEKRVCGGMYATNSQHIATDRPDWSIVELTVECKRGDTQDDPFSDDERSIFYPMSIPRRENLEQILSYSNLIFERQQRTHHFTVMVCGTYARLVRWDRSGAVFSERFNYKTEPHKLGRFFWRFSRMSPDARGHDGTATRVLPGSADYKIMTARQSQVLPIGDHARRLFKDSLKEDWPWWRLEVVDENGSHQFLVGCPNFVAPGVIGRGTRGYVALDVTDPDPAKCVFVYLKDCWRVVHERSEREGGILGYLNERGVKRIPTRHCDGDIASQVTMTQDVWKKLNPKKVEQCSLKIHQHYRLVVKEVGIPLREFTNAKQLVTVIKECVQAHEDAYLNAGVLHRDISAGNLLMYPIEPQIKGSRPRFRGLLADWELSKRISTVAQPARHPDRTGTWQFMSVSALNDPSKQIEIPDELESFFHTLLWFAIRYLPNNCVNVGDFMTNYFDGGEKDPWHPDEYACGRTKESVITSGVITLPTSIELQFLLPPGSLARVPDQPSIAASSSTKSKPVPTDIPALDKHPISKLIETLLTWFSARYQLGVLDRKAAAEQKAALIRPTFTEEDADRDGDDALREEMAARKNKGQAWITRKADRARLEEDAANLLSHEPMIVLMIERLLDSEVVWPVNDKTEDQLLKDYNSDKTQTLKRRPATHDGDELYGAPQSASKRPCTTGFRA
ncbi:hypothetical protein C8Q79DRAFT_1011319 [Trametes meyenii]|nr:hypothetical protein C8Q79DRAFT_1011319 [Trametes meyenii]